MPLKSGPEDDNSMGFNDEITTYYRHADRKFQMPYKELAALQLDIGYYSVVENGRDFHKISRDITLSVMKFHNGRISNLVFSNNRPLRLELMDTELTSFFCDYIELRYVLSGHLEMEIEGKTAGFDQSEICFIDSMAYHREFIDKSECVMVNICVDRKFFNDSFLSNIGLSPLQQFLRASIMKQSHNQHYLKFTPDEYAQSEKIKDYLSQIFFEVKNALPGYIEISKGYIIRLMDHLSTGYKYNFSQDDSATYSRKLYESVVEFMNDNLDSVSMEDLTEKFHYQANYFNNLIKKHTGCTYSQYLIRLRMEKAKILLSSSMLPIDEIMYLVGYNNKGFFYKKFTEYVGVTPARYRDSL